MRATSGLGTKSQSGWVRRQPIDASLTSMFLSLPFSLSLKKLMKMSSGDDKKDSVVEPGNLVKMEGGIAYINSPI